MITVRALFLFFSSPIGTVIDNRSHNHPMGFYDDWKTCLAGIKVENVTEKQTGRYPLCTRVQTFASVQLLQRANRMIEQQHQCGLVSKDTQSWWESKHRDENKRTD